MILVVDPWWYLMVVGVEVDWCSMEVLVYNPLVDHVGIHGQRRLTEALNKDSLVQQKEYPFRRRAVFVYMSAACRALGGLLTSTIGRQRPSPSRSGHDGRVRRIPNCDVFLRKVGRAELRKLCSARDEFLRRELGPESLKVPAELFVCDCEIERLVEVLPVVVCPSGGMILVVDPWRYLMVVGAGHDRLLVVLHSAIAFWSRRWWASHSCRGVWRQGDYFFDRSHGYPFCQNGLVGCQAIATRVLSRRLDPSHLWARRFKTEASAPFSFPFPFLLFFFFVFPLHSPSSSCVLGFFVVLVVLGARSRWPF
ncbi:hypothetical protein Taro_039414 [Colocasia esculenta]|uniref:Uncharacterized protein n=1 Tax=Colocasia esculenta TaxID=4460 RepID=A0A843WGL4_COLES|nr:hypothetical protein [Colocasia esculenta]